MQKFCFMLNVSILNILLCQFNEACICYILFQTGNTRYQFIILIYFHNYTIHCTTSVEHNMEMALGELPTMTWIHL